MTRSSRHKSSKHSSREARDYSDSEKDSSVKERNGKEDNSSARVSKESEKRKLDAMESKDAFGSGNGEYADEYSSSSKRRKDRALDDGVSDRWNGRGKDERIESSRKSKGSSESSKSKRRDDGEEQRSKTEGKQRESSRKENREGRKVKEGKSERFVENEECTRVVNDKTDSNTQDQLPGPESENQHERRVRRRRDSSGDRDKHEVDIGDINDKRRDDVGNDGRQKDGKHKDERCRDKFREDVDRHSRHRGDKLRDDQPDRDRTNSRSDDKHLKDEKNPAESRQKKSKLLESDRDVDREYDLDHDYSHERDSDIGRDRERGRDHDHVPNRNRNHEQDRNYDLDGDCEWDRERNRELERGHDCHEHIRDREWERERERVREPDSNRVRDRDLDLDRERDDDDGSHLDERSFNYKCSRGQKRSPDECDDGTAAKSRGSKVHYSDMENKSLSGNRVESDANRRSQSHQACVDSSSNRQRTSLSTTRSNGGTDEYRHIKLEDSKYRDSVAEQVPKLISSKDVGGFSAASDRGSKYRSMERSIKMEDGYMGEIAVERSSSSKASPMGLVERSPSTSVDGRYGNRNSTNGARRSFDIEETVRRSSTGPGEFSATEDGLSRELPFEKPLMAESAQMDLLYYNRTNQSNSSSLPPSSAFRARVGSPSFMGSLEDGRVGISGRYRRSGDSSVGRVQGNAWRGTPNWSAPIPNGFIHFQHGPPHGGYPAMLPQFPSPSMFTVRPPLEMNHSGIPYHIHDADRFGGHLRPLGWQDMMDGSGPPRLHGWDGNNGSFRDEPHMFGGADWEQIRHSMNGRGWETSSADMWKGENGDANMDLRSTSQKEDHPVQAPLDDELAGQEAPQAEHENNHGVHDNSIETRSISAAKESFNIFSKTDDEMPDPPKVSSADNFAQCCFAYLSKLDISMELAGPDLYSRCMGLLGLDQTATVDKDTAMIVNLKDGGRVVSKSSKTFPCPLLPAANDSIFQRAMDHYKKQRVQTTGLRNGETLDILSPSDGEKVEQGAFCIVDKTMELVIPYDTVMLDACIVTSDHNKPKAVSVSDVQEGVEELVSTPGPVAKDHNHTLESNLKCADQDSTPRSLEETAPALNGYEVDETTAEKVISADADGDHYPSPNNATAVAPISPTDGEHMDDDSSKSKDDNSVYSGEGRQVIADATSGPLSGAMMMPGSNECESVMLSRIHRSPESTR